MPSDVNSGLLTIKKWRRLGNARISAEWRIKPSTKLVGVPTNVMASISSFLRDRRLTRDYSNEVNAWSKFGPTGDILGHVISIFHGDRGRTWTSVVCRVIIELLPSELGDITSTRNP